MVKQTRIKPMHQARQHGKTGLLLRGAALATCALVLVACESKREITGSVTQDYHQRHPITLQQSARVIDIPVGMHSEKLTPSSQSAIAAFARDFRRDRAAVVQVMVPSGANNEMNASYMAREIRTSLMREGVKPAQIDLFPYTAADATDAPIRLAYPRVEAKTLACGAQPETPTDGYENLQNFDFGCASQQNLAVAVANPQDLIQPRGWEARDAMRRSSVTESYRNGDPTWSEDLDANSGTSSEVKK